MENLNKINLIIFNLLIIMLINNNNKRKIIKIMILIKMDINKFKRMMRIKIINYLIMIMLIYLLFIFYSGENFKILRIKTFSNRKKKFKVKMKRNWMLI